MMCQTFHNSLRTPRDRKKTEGWWKGDGAGGGGHVSLLGDSGGVVNSLEFYTANFKGIFGGP